MFTADDARKLTNKEEQTDDPTFILIRDYIFEKIKHAAAQKDFSVEWKNDIYYVRHSQSETTWSVPNKIYDALVACFESHGFAVIRGSGNWGLSVNWYPKKA